MKLQKSNILHICVALIAIVANPLFAVNLITPANASLSQESGIYNITSYDVPGEDPWGTAFDRSGRVWVVLPGCDLVPSCPSSTPPGKLVLFDPNKQRWVSVVALSSSDSSTSTVATTPIPIHTPMPTSTPMPVTSKTLGQDTFQRGHQSLWGTASGGQRWGGDANRNDIEERKG